jgi:uncharacterized membrane protein
MSSPASIAKHPIHPMLIAFPIGLWVFALICDVVRLAGGAEVWSMVALYSLAGGIVGAILAAIPGLIDYFSIDEAEMKRIATNHLLLNVGALIIFALSFYLRLRSDAQSIIPFLLSLLGVILIGIGGWLGGKMVYVKGMAVEAVEQLDKKVKKLEQKSEPQSRPSVRRAG